MNGNIKIYIPPISTSFTIFYFQLKKLEIVGFAQFYLINCAAIQKDLVFELQLSRNKQPRKKAQKLQKNSLPFYCDACVAQCHKIFLITSAALGDLLGELPSKTVSEEHVCIYSLSAFPRRNVLLQYYHRNKPSLCTVIFSFTETL